jgi:MFS family permease
VIVDNAYAPSSWFYRVNSVFYDPSIYGRFLVVAIVVGLALVLFAAVFAARLAIDDPDALIANFYAVPIALLAAEIGMRAGLAAAAFAFALGVFGIGECFHGTVQNALIADLAKPGLLGRYMALNGFAFQLGGAGGRAIGGFALALAPHALWIVAALAALGAGGAMLALERFIPPPLRRTPRHERTPPRTAAVEPV